ncbi:nuclear transport factor 2 family protein [Streptomyces sp. 900105755]
MSRSPYEQLQADKEIVNEFYQAGVRGDLASFGKYLHPDFCVTAPNYLPWGGTHSGSSYYLNEVLAHLPESLDFSRFDYQSFIGENGHVVALIRIGITGTDSTIKISEHWEVRDGLARSIWVAYFEPQALLDKLGISGPGR